jgi:hypothetical protein
MAFKGASYHSGMTDIDVAAILAARCPGTTMCLRRGRAGTTAPMHIVLVASQYMLTCRVAETSDAEPQPLRASE